LSQSIELIPVSGGQQTGTTSSSVHWA
jgi:hypothetical protein